jgi:hypothetical protein
MRSVNHSRPDPLRLLSWVLTVAVLIPLGLTALVATAVADMSPASRHGGIFVGLFLVTLGGLFLYSSVRRYRVDRGRPGNQPGG